jgi:hypothetical protein
MTSPPPFFIVGTPRSGTTLLQSALSAHSTLVIPPEEDLIVTFYDRFGPASDPLTEADVQWFVDVLFDDVRSIRYWKIDRHRLLKRLLALDDRSFRNTIEATYREFMSRFPSKTRWGCKAPFYVRHLDKVQSVIPEAKFLHMVRDPRAVHASMSARRRRGDTYFTESPWKNAWQWNSWVRSGLRWSRDFPGRCLELQYEQLVESPKQTLSSVCEFLEIPFEERMLSHYEHTTETALIGTDNIDRYLKRDFSLDCIDAWKERCTSRELRIVEGLTGEMMRELDYAPTQNSASPPRASTIACYRFCRGTGENTRSALRYLRSRYRDWIGPLPSWTSLSRTRFKTRLAASLWRGRRSVQAS